MISGTLHAGVWPLLEDDGTGPLSIRKPVLFGISTGVTLLSLAWVARLVTAWRHDPWLRGLVAWSAALEVALITLQYWRGVPSHFYAATPLDAALGWAIGGLTTVLAAGIFLWTARTFGTWPAEPEMRLATQVGMLLLSLGCVLGFAIAAYGGYRLSQSEAPEIFGRAGITKFAHGMPIHAIQGLMPWAWLLGRCRIAPRRRWQSVASLSAAMALASGYSLAQTLLGRARWDASPWTLILLAAGVIFGMASLWPLIVSEKSQRQPAVKPWPNR